MSKVWKYKELDAEKIENYKKKFKVSKLLATLLVARNIPENEIEGYLKIDIAGLNNPYMLDDMNLIVDRILIARDKKEKVVIYGDYDVDGITSITIMYNFLKNIDIDVGYYLPDRIEEGYGLNIKALDDLKAKGTDLVITVDCGISALDEVEHSRKIGLDIVVTDHHECGEILPNAIAVVNPKRKNSKYPFDTLAGVGVAFKVIQALAKRLNMPDESYLKYIDIVAIGTIADIVPLLGENRIIAYNGLMKLAKTECEGIKALLRTAKIEKIDSDSISFGLAPRINASGRMADASVAVKLFLAKDELEAYEYAKILDEQNKMRQEVEKQIFNEAVKKIEDDHMELRSSIVLSSEGWHSGVIGIVASKLTEKYLKPVVLLSCNNGIAKGSARIPQGISLYNAISKCSDLLIAFGGHELAAGLSLQTDQIQEFTDRFEDVIANSSTGEFVSIVDIDSIIESSEITFDLVKDIARLAPFGQGNRMPIFVCKSMKVESICTLKDNKHLKFTLRAGDLLIEALAFGMGNRRDEIILGDKIDVACNVNVNAYMGNIKLQLMIIDFKKSAKLK